MEWFDFWTRHCTLSVLTIVLLFQISHVQSSNDEFFAQSLKYAKRVKELSFEHASDIMEYGYPVVIRNFGHEVLQWPAFETWNESFMIKEISEVKVHASEKRTTRMHTPAHPFANSHHDIQWKRPYVEKMLSTETFFSSRESLSKVSNATKQEYFSFFSPLNELPEIIQKGVKDVWGLGLGHRPVLEVNMWIGLPGVSTPLHYDGVHNSYVQVHGSKTFMLMSPSAWKHIHLFPKLHPSSRMSQLNPSSLENELRQCLPEDYQTDRDKDHGSGDGGSLQVMSVTLNPGDVLYIPPFWFHHVSTVTSVETTNKTPHASSSISISVHSDSVDMDIRDGTTGRVGGGFSAPIWGGLTQSQRVAILTFYLEEIISNVVNCEFDLSNNINEQDTPRWSPEEFVGALLESRYSRLSEDVEVVGLVERLKGAEESFTRSTFIPAQPMDINLKNMIKSHAQGFIQWRKSRIHIEQSVWEIMLHDFIEDVSGSVVGALTVPAYLKWFKQITSNSAPALHVENNPAFRREVDISLLEPKQWDLEGTDDQFASFGQSVSIHYSVYLATPWPSENGTPQQQSTPQRLSNHPFDTTREEDGTAGTPFVFKVGGGGVIAGLERAILRLKLGKRVEVFIPSGLAYGSLGVGDGSVVPPYSHLIFDIELVSISKS